MKSGWQKTLVQFNACLLSAVLVFVQTSVMAEPVNDQAPADAGNTDLQQTLDTLNRAFDALEAAQKEIPRDTFDPEAALDLAGLDVKDVFHWVRDNTYFVPYQGALRGAPGVLMDRTGNSLDRALLLNELLHLLGYQTRLARGQLTQAQVEDLFSKVRPIPLQGAMPPAKPTADSSNKIKSYAKKFGLDSNLLKTELDKLTKEQGRLQKLAAERIAEQTAFLLEKIGQPPDSAFTEQRAQQLDKMKDHWWLQFQDGANWVSLDSTLSDAEAGQSFAEPVETRFVSSLNNLDVSLLHSVRIRVVLECWYDGGLHEETVLESPRLHPSELLGQPLTLHQIPVNWNVDLNLLANGNPDELLKTSALAQNVWAPALRIGSKMLLDRAYTNSCNLDDAPRLLSAAGKLGGSVSHMFEGVANTLEALEGETSETAVVPRKDGRVTAQWIDYEVATPGESGKTIRRQIFDLIGPAVRKTGIGNAPEFTEQQELTWRLALLGETDILLLGTQMSPDFNDQLTQKTVLENRRFLISLLSTVISRDPVAIANQAAGMPALNSFELSALALARNTWAVSPNAVFMNQVNILSHHRQLRPGLDNQVTIQEAYDIVANDVASNLSTGGNPFLARLQQGVVDSNAETLLATMNCRDKPGTTTSSQLLSVTELFVASQLKGIKWDVVRNEKELADLDRPDLKRNPDLRARIEADLATGYMLVIPKQATGADAYDSLAWWRIAKNTGEVLGINANGWGGAMTEYLVIGVNVITNLLGVYSFLSCLKDVYHLNPCGALGCAYAGFGAAKFPKTGAIGALGYLVVSLALFVVSSSFCPS